MGGCYMIEQVSVQLRGSVKGTVHLSVTGLWGGVEGLALHKKTNPTLLQRNCSQLG